MDVWISSSVESVSMTIIKQCRICYLSLPSSPGAMDKMWISNSIESVSITTILFCSYEWTCGYQTVQKFYPSLSSSPAAMDGRVDIKQCRICIHHCHPLPQQWMDVWISNSVESVSITVILSRSNGWTCGYQTV